MNTGVRRKSFIRVSFIIEDRPLVTTIIPANDRLHK